MRFNAVLKITAGEGGTGSDLTGESHRKFQVGYGKGKAAQQGQLQYHLAFFVRGDSLGQGVVESQKNIAHSIADVFGNIHGTHGPVTAGQNGFSIQADRFGVGGDGELEIIHRAVQMNGDAEAYLTFTVDGDGGGTDQ